MYAHYDPNALSSCSVAAVHRRGDAPGGMVAAVERLGDLLGEVLPIEAGDENELPNELVLLD